jgi:uncharacterized membrane protein YgcG
MKRLLLSLLLLPMLALSQTPDKLVHNPHLYVDDYAGVYTDQQKIQLDSIIRAFKDTVQISVVTIKSFEGEQPYQYLVELGRRWGVGSKSNNGLLIVHAINDRHIEVATGYGIEGDLPDILVVQLQRQYATPLFKQGNLYGGMKALVQAYIQQLSPAAKELRAAQMAKQKEIDKRSREDFVDGLFKVMFGIVVAIILVLVYAVYATKRRKKREAIEEYKQKELRDIAMREDIRKTNRRTLETAKSFLVTNPKSEELLAKYHDRTDYINKYKAAREALRESIQLMDYPAINRWHQVASGLISIILAPKFASHPTPKQPSYHPELKSKPKDDDTALKNKRKKEQEEEEEEERRRKKRREEEDSSSSSSSIWSSGSSSSSSSSSDSSSSSSDFGGGSFGGGGGGSDY